MTIEPGSIPAALAGGIMIGSAAVAMMWLHGRILGVSGIAGGLLAREAAGGRGWRAVFLAGMLSGGFVVSLAFPAAFPGAVTGHWPLLVGAGLVVGVGTRMGAGCTSGHGVCGMSRLSPRSFVATGVFMLVAMVTVFIVRHPLGGLP